ncbi:hypothetical protein SAMN05216227_100199 [Pseudorhodobacter antarcticus]|uniref:Argininosuccinate lyase n=1 Tax=Pseudorhodobacter antarcticus TaxID=1077947 RepID=A0A1H8AEL2_9RHOB|nr:hypothetical protein [Pseudorhodobacter antarcticus]SEM68916.1 hypothetical protein SAMN05216227_100199 [Pseudorhodobacter antarcticus]
MRITLALLTALTLAACGADGAPTAPTETGVTISGDARVGVTS